MKQPWEWMSRWTAEGKKESAANRQVLYSLLWRSESISIENPDARLALFEQGRELAQRHQEAWWAVVFEDLKCETLLYYKHDPEAALQVAARLVVETRKPEYLALPQRIAVQLNFIAAYSKIDPIGYKQQIREAIDSGQADWATYENYHAYYWQLRTRFLIATRNPEALESAWQHYRIGSQYHSLSGDSSEHYTVYALADLLTALWTFDRDGSRLHTLELAELGLRLAPRTRNTRLVAIFTMWCAVGVRYEGDETEADRLYRRALEKQVALSVPRNAVYFGALAFHEVGDDGQKMLAVCEEAINIAVAHGWPFDTASNRWRKCEILKQMGLDWNHEADRLREVVKTMPSRQYWEKQLHQLEEDAGE